MAAGSHSTCDIEGKWIELLNPATAALTCEGAGNAMTFQFLSADLVGIATLLHEKFANDTDCLLNVTWSDTFPYRTHQQNLWDVLSYFACFMSLWDVLLT